MAVQIGRKKQIPIYGTTTTTGPILSTDTLSNYFKITQGSSYGWSNNILSASDRGTIESTPDNVGVNSSTATVTFEAVRDLSGIRIDYIYYTESNYDKITVSIGSEILLNAVSGVAGPSNPMTGSITYENLVMNRTIYQGEKITFKYVKDSSQSHTYERYTKFIIQCPPYTTTTTEITGYEEKLLPQIISNLYLSPTKKVIGGWIKSSSGAKLFYGGLEFEYTGNYTISDIEINNIQYKLYALTSSGTLKLKKNASIWACGGGGGGNKGSSNSTTTLRGGGGGGGGGYVTSGEISSGSYAVVIGSGGGGSKNGGGTTVSTYSAIGGKHGANTADGGAGGSGGGSAGRSSNSNYLYGIVGTGSKVNTIPFGITDLKAHCAGGGGGGNKCRTSSDAFRPTKGGDGGTNGSNGLKATSGAIEGGGDGGTYGGGAGGGPNESIKNGKSATYYGSGGGGGYAYYSADYSPILGSGGAGYQGIVYVLIPAQKE